MNFERRNLLWLDGLGGLVVGIAMMPAIGLLSDWHQLPRATLLLMGVANLLYGTYSVLLASRRVRPLVLIHFLIAANIGWSFVCGGIVVAYRLTITPLGITHLLFEAVYVGGLGLLEWRWRTALQ